MEKPRRTCLQCGKRVAWEGECERSRPWHDRGSPAVIGTSSFRPVALRPRLSTGLPFSLQKPRQTRSYGAQCRSVAQYSQVLKCVAALNRQ